MNKLHPGARWLFRINSFIIILFILFFVGMFSSISIVAAFLGSSLSLGFFVATFIGIIFFTIIFAEIYARLAYANWAYEFNDEGLRLERGIIWKRYSNIPYERIQNVDVHRGIIARILGFSTVMVQTAGFSGAVAAEGNIPAVSANDAEKIRSFVMKKITGKKK